MLFLLIIYCHLFNKTGNVQGDKYEKQQEQGKEASQMMRNGTQQKKQERIEMLGNWKLEISIQEQQPSGKQGKGQQRIDHKQKKIERTGETDVACRVH